MPTRRASSGAMCAHRQQAARPQIGAARAGGGHGRKKLSLLHQGLRSARNGILVHNRVKWYPVKVMDC